MDVCTDPREKSRIQLFDPEELLEFGLGPSAPDSETLRKRAPELQESPVPQANQPKT